MGLSPLSLATVAKTALALDTVKVRYSAALSSLVEVSPARDILGAVFATEPAGPAVPHRQLASSGHKRLVALVFNSWATLPDLSISVHDE